MEPVEFASVARQLGDAAREAGLRTPAFRSPPRVDADRTIRRYEGSVVVSVRLRDRPRDVIVADMIDGIIAANRLDGTEALKMRALLSETLF